MKKIVLVPLEDVQHEWAATNEHGGKFFCPFGQPGPVAFCGTWCALFDVQERERGRSRIAVCGASGSDIGEIVEEENP